MFDRATCPDQARPTAEPFVSLTALSALGELLRQASSSAPHPSASSFSHDQIRGEDHGSDGFNQLRQAPEDVHAGSARTHAATELFGDERPGALVGTPAWRDLPAATQAVLTNLMARLIVDHAETRRADPVAGAVHDL